MSHRNRKSPGYPRPSCSQPPPIADTAARPSKATAALGSAYIFTITGRFFYWEYRGCNRSISIRQIVRHLT